MNEDRGGGDGQSMMVLSTIYMPVGDVGSIDSCSFSFKGGGRVFLLLVVTTCTTYEILRSIYFVNEDRCSWLACFTLFGSRGQPLLVD